MADDRAALGVGALVGRAAVKGPAVVKRGAARRHSIGTRSSSAPAGRHRRPGMRQPVVGGMEAAAQTGVRPPVRAAHVIDRARVGRGVIERHPAGDHVGRIEVIKVGGVRRQSSALPEGGFQIALS